MVSRAILVVLAFAILVGCDDYRETEVREETATVIQLAYVPAGFGSGSGVGVSASGNMVVTTSNVSIPARWSTVFRCDGHGATFALDGKEIYSRATVGQIVTLRYVDVIATNSDGVERLADTHTREVVWTHPHVAAEVAP